MRVRERVGVDGDSDGVGVGVGESDEEVQAEINTLVKKTTKLSNELRINTLLSGEADGNDCFIEINAGAGGTESQDWADMLRRMYLKWSDNKDFKYQIVSEHKGDEAGIKSTTIKLIKNNEK